jgi:AmmeMemoRadiSam system protein A
MAASSCIELHQGEREQLLAIARQSLHRGFGGETPEAATDGLTGALAAQCGVFVTLTQSGALRGCIGSMYAAEPLAQSVAEAAYGAAFRDPRFPELKARECVHTRIEISILSRMEAVSACSREELLARLHPGRDGLLLEDRRHHATFLPKVWEQLPDPGQFLDHLLLKAGLEPGHWSTTLRFRRYQTTSFSDSEHRCAIGGAGAPPRE